MISIDDQNYNQELEIKHASQKKPIKILGNPDDVSSALEDSVSRHGAAGGGINDSPMQ